MSYAHSAQLQRLVYDRLTSDAELTALVGANVFDTAPSGQLPELYVVLGTEKVSDASDISGQASVHELLISVVTSATGFLSAKEAAGHISRVLDLGGVDLTGCRLTQLRFSRADAKREADGSLRRIDMIFRARMDAQ